MKKSFQKHKISLIIILLVFFRYFNLIIWLFDDFIIHERPADAEVDQPPAVLFKLPGQIVLQRPIRIEIRSAFEVFAIIGQQQIKGQILTNGGHL